MRVFERFPASVVFLPVLGMLFIASAARAGSGYEGGEHSGGGSYRELQFKGIGYAIVDVLKSSKKIPPALTQIDLKRLKLAIDQTVVEATDEILRPSPDGEVVLASIKDALNTPSEKTIRFNIDSWDAIPTGSRRAAVVLHEYLGVLLLAASHYQFSHFLTDDPALRFWFDHLEIARSITDSATLDFPVVCSAQFQDEKPEELDFIGFRKTESGLEIQKSETGRGVVRDEKTGRLLAVILTDASNDDERFTDRVLGRPEKKRGLRIIVGWTDNLFHEPSDPIFSQTLAISPNLNFELTLAQPRIRLECHRAPILERTTADIPNV